MPRRLKNNKAAGIARGWPMGGSGRGPANLLRTLRTLQRAFNVLVIADSQGAGRGTGSGPVQMDGAREQAWPARMCEFLISLGYPALAESFCTANNTGGDPQLYNPRIITNGSFSQAASGFNMGGPPFAAPSGTSGFNYRPFIPVDTFEFYYPRNTTIDTTVLCRIDAASDTSLSQNGGAAAFVKSTFVAAGGVGIHTFRVQRNTGTTSAFIQNILAYNSQIKDFRILNMSARGWSTIDWITSDLPYRALPAVASMISSGDIAIISLGGNDLRSGGAGTTLAQFEANMRLIIDTCLATGSKVILATPMPIDIAEESTFTQVQMIAVYNRLASDYNILLFRGDIVLGTWAAANAAGLTSDTLHWKAPASVAYGWGITQLVLSTAGFVV